MRNCPVCQSDFRDVLFTMPSKQTINCCVECGMVFSDGLPPMDYANDSIYTCAVTYPAQPEHYRKIVQNCIAHGVKKDARILDVGCALGGLMKAFIEAGYPHISGISLSAGEVAYCREQGLMATVCDVANPLPEHFDLVTVSHVLEHVPDVPKFLGDLRRWIKPGGRVYIEVPDATSYAGHFTSICQGFNSEHINHFDHNHLGEALLRNGFHLRDYEHYLFDGYPCVCVLAEPRWFNANLRVKVEAYRDKLVPQIKRVIEHLTCELDGIECFSIWGIGQTTQMLLASGVIPSERVVEVTDTNTAYHSKQIEGLYVRAPQDFHPAPDMPILVCSQLHSASIIDRIREMGLTNRIITLED